MKKIYVIISFAIALLFLISCGTIQKNENLIFKIREGEHIQSMQSLSLTTTNKKNNSSMEFYLEYSANEEFIFIEAGITRSSEPDTIFKFNQPGLNLDGYGIQTGQSWNSLTKKETFKSIITVPDKEEYVEEEYILVNFKISINGKEENIMIDKVDSIKFSRDLDGEWSQIEEAMQEIKFSKDLNSSNQNMIFSNIIEVLKDNIKSIEVELIVDGIYVKDISSFLIRIVGDWKSEIIYKISHGGLVKEFSYTYMNFINWNDNISFNDVNYHLVQHKLDITPEINIDKYSGEMLEFSRTINNENINGINFNRFQNFTNEIIKIRLFGFEESEVFDVIQSKFHNIEIYLDYEIESRIKIINGEPIALL